MADEDTPFDVPDVEDLDDVQLGEAEGDLGTAEIVTLVLRSLTLVLSMVGGLVLVMMIMRRRRGSWLEALTVVTIHILWQAMSWYRDHVDATWVKLLSEGTVDSETTKVVFIFFKNLLEGLAMFTGVVVVSRLGSLVGSMLYILTGISILAPVAFSVIVLLIDLSLSHLDRTHIGTVIGIASFKIVMYSIIPLGLLLSWIIFYCRVSSRLQRTSREVASNLVCAGLVVFHLVKIAQFVVYIILKIISDGDIDLDTLDLINSLSIAGVGLTEGYYLLATVSLPWAWVLGLILPVSDNQGLDHNLKLAKQNKHRNVIKYEKAKNTPSAVSTPPTSPYKFSPEVTSSPSVLNGVVQSRPGSSGGPSMNPDVVPLAETGKEKRNSYLEAVSNSSLHVLEDAPPRHTKSADPLWLPTTGKPVDL